MQDRERATSTVRPSGAGQAASNSRTRARPALTLFFPGHDGPDGARDVVH